jgi:hypothetical protein
VNGYTERFIENSTGLLGCEWTESLNPIEFLWYKDDKPVDSKEMGLNLTSFKMQFLRLDHLINDGVYKCGLRFSNNQTVISQNSIDINVERK